MRVVNASAAVAIVFFSVVLAGFIGARVDQITIALLGGTFIGLVVAVPATALVVWIVLRQRDPWSTGSQQRATQSWTSLEQPPASLSRQTMTTINVQIVFVRPGANRAERIEALMQTGLTFEAAQRAMADGSVRVLELPAGQ
jgi:hypothetical protein